MSYLQRSGYKSPYGKYVSGAPTSPPPPPPAPLAPAFVDADNVLTYAPAAGIAGQFTYPENNIYGVSIRYGTEATPVDFETLPNCFDDFPAASAPANTVVDFAIGGGELAYETDYYLYSVSYLDALGAYTAITVFGPIQTWPTPPQPNSISIAYDITDWSPGGGFTLHWQNSYDTAWAQLLTENLTAGNLVEWDENEGSGFDEGDIFAGTGEERIITQHQTLPTTPDPNWGICDFYETQASVQTPAETANQGTNADSGTAFQLGSINGGETKIGFHSVEKETTVWFEFTTNGHNGEDLIWTWTPTPSSPVSTAPTLTIYESDGSTQIAQAIGSTTVQFTTVEDTTYYLSITNIDAENDIYGYLGAEYQGV